MEATATISTQDGMIAFTFALRIQNNEPGTRSKHG
jgi:hypothetical protein